MAWYRTAQLDTHSFTHNIQSPFKIYYQALTSNFLIISWGSLHESLPHFTYSAMHFVLTGTTLVMSRPENSTVSSPKFGQRLYNADGKCHDFFVRTVSFQHVRIIFLIAKVWLTHSFTHSLTHYAHKHQLQSTQARHNTGQAPLHTTPADMTTPPHQRKQPE